MRWFLQELLGECAVARVVVVGMGDSWWERL